MVPNRSPNEALGKTWNALGLHFHHLKSPREQGNEGHQPDWWAHCPMTWFTLLSPTPLPFPSPYSASPLDPGLVLPPPPGSLPR